MIASAATLAALEYPSLLELFAAEARTDLGASRLRALLPTADRAELERRRAGYLETERLALDEPVAPSLGVALAPLVERIATEQPPLEGAEVLVVARLLAAAGGAVERIRAADPPLPELARRAAGIGDVRPLVDRIGRVLDARGEVRDDASPRLLELARQARAARERIYGRLERLRAEEPDLFPEETVPMRGGRLLLLLSAGARGRTPGLVHGRSGSGRSYYFEPLGVVEENNALQGAVEEQEAERARLLRELLAELAAALPAVEALAGLLGELDAWESAARLGREAGAILCPLAEPGRLALRAARHPLLEPRLARRRERALGFAGHTGEAVPLELELGDGRRVLVVTGPNAGGKTVALKTLGLAACAAQAGLPIACAPASELPVFERIVATVGDEQDLLADRSTFSGRLERLAEAWQAAGPSSLVLLDELGSGTDPEEGAALSVALLERLLGTGGLALVTTHLATVALAALEREGAGCAAMEFEPASGRPTFRLRPGAPGASEAIALARRLGLPAAWVARAEELVGTGHRDLRRVLAELEATRAELERSEAESRQRAAEAATAADRLERERAALEAERRMVGQRLEGELRGFRDRVRLELRTAEERLRREFEAGRRRGVAAEEAARLLADPPAVPPAVLGALAAESAAATDRPLVVGHAVRHRGLGWTGTLERLEDGRAEVAVAGKRVRCAADELVAAGASAAEPAGRVDRADRARPAAVDDAAPVAAAELLLLGRRVEESLDAIDVYLDQALRAGRAEVRIVHGHGTGRLRDAIRQHLRQHPGVARFRAGAPNEGGNGATVVALRE